MTSTTSRDLTALRTAMAGAVIDPGHADFDEARKVWNADIDRRPTAIARCTSAQDVAAAVRFATAAGLEIAVRGGGAQRVGSERRGRRAGHRPLAHATRSASTRRPGGSASQGGAQLADLDAATQAHGLAVPGGHRRAHRGRRAHARRRHGLADPHWRPDDRQPDLRRGRPRRRPASCGPPPTSSPDLFWALRGGGGNFGVVTEFEFRCHAVGPMIQFGMFFWGLDQGVEALRFVRDLDQRLPRETHAGDRRR